MALYEREKSGQSIEVPMFETMVSFNLVEHLGGETFVPPIAGMGYERVLSPHRKPYRTRDGFIGLLSYTNAHWKRFFEIAGTPEHAADPRFNDPVKRSENINALYAILAGLVAERTTAEWESLLKDADVPMAPIATPEGPLEDAHLRATGFFRQKAHPTEDNVRTVGIPLTFSRAPGLIQTLAPRLGQDGTAVREEHRPTLEDPDPLEA